ncbi:hypoxanthine phosphoribosyltransferase [soil metagenome]
MHRDIQRVLISQYQILARVREMAEKITADFTEHDITIVPVMTGAMIFCGDLIRQIPIHMRIGLLTVSSYPGASITTRGSQVVSQQLGDVRGRHVLLVDDILDSGGTLRLIVPILKEAGAIDVKTCVLLRKDRPIAKETPADYVGFEIPDEFVVGYGLDYNNYYRNLPDIVTLTPAAVERMRTIC